MTLEELVEMERGMEFERLYHQVQKGLTRMRKLGFPPAYSEREQEIGMDLLEQAQESIWAAWNPDAESYYRED